MASETTGQKGPWLVIDVAAHEAYLSRESSLNELLRAHRPHRHVISLPLVLAAEAANDALLIAYSALQPGRPDASRISAEAVVRHALRESGVDARAAIAADEGAAKSRKGAP